MTRASYVFCAIAGLIAIPGPALSQNTFQHDCHFEHVAKADSHCLTRANVSWQVSAARKSGDARIAVASSGTYNGRANSFASGAVEFVFSTDNSNEVITIGINGEALWEIDLRNGEEIVYFGGCKPAKRTN